MWIMDKIREGMRSFLRLEPPQSLQINIQEQLDYQANAIKNRLWYRGDSNELEQLYQQISDGNMRRMFWASRSTPGMELRKIHTGLPSIIVDTLSGIVVGNLSDISFSSQVYTDLWKEVEKENRFKKLLDRSLKEVLYIGDGAWKISIDKEVSDLPVVEFFPGDRVDYTMKRGRVMEVIFKSPVRSTSGDRYELREIYGFNSVRYELYRDGKPHELSEVDGLEDLVPVIFGSESDRYMMAVPVQFYPSGRWEGRGQSIFDRKVENFDALDEAWSQWMDALRAGRTKTYIPEKLIPRDPNNGQLRRPNPFDDRFIATATDMAQGAENKIQTTQPAIPHDSYVATYATALDQCLQGLISPSTLGIDIKKLDNADAQREKEKVTLYTRNSIVELLQEDLKKLAETVVKVAFEMRGQSAPAEIQADVAFGDYANPSFESQVETVGKAKTQGIMSIEASVDELYGDSRDEEWKQAEVDRLKAEQGLVTLEEPAVNLDVLGGAANDVYGVGGQESLPGDAAAQGQSAEAGQ